MESVYFLVTHEGVPHKLILYRQDILTDEGNKQVQYALRLTPVEEDITVPEANEHTSMFIALSIMWQMAQKELKQKETNE